MPFITIPQGFDNLSANPLDRRYVVAGDPWGQDGDSVDYVNSVNAFEGLQVYNTSNNKLYILTDATDVQNESSWEEVGSGGGSGFDTAADYNVTGDWNFRGDVTIQNSDGSSTYINWDPTNLELNAENGAEFVLKDAYDDDILNRRFTIENVIDSDTTFISGLGADTLVLRSGQLAQDNSLDRLNELQKAPPSIDLEYGVLFHTSDSNPTQQTAGQISFTGLLDGSATRRDLGDIRLLYTATDGGNSPDYSNVIPKISVNIPDTSGNDNEILRLGRTRADFYKPAVLEVVDGTGLSDLTQYPASDYTGGLLMLKDEDTDGSDGVVYYSSGQAWRKLTGSTNPHNLVNGDGISISAPDPDTGDETISVNIDTSNSGGLEFTGGVLDIRDNIGGDRNFTGSVSFDNNAQFRLPHPEGDQSSPDEAAVWYNDSDNLIKYQDNAGVQTLATRDYVDAQDNDNSGILDFRSVRSGSQTWTLQVTPSGPVSYTSNTFGLNGSNSLVLFYGTSEAVEEHTWSGIPGEILVKISNNSLEGTYIVNGANINTDTDDNHFASALNVVHLDGDNILIDTEASGQSTFVIETQPFVTSHTAFGNYSILGRDGSSVGRRQINGYVPSPDNDTDDTHHFLSGNTVWQFLPELNFNSSNAWTGAHTFASNVNIGGSASVSNTQSAITAASDHATDVSNSIFINGVNYYDSDRVYNWNYLAQTADNLTDSSIIWSNEILTRYRQDNSYQTSGTPLVNQFAYYREEGGDGFGQWEINIDRAGGEETSLVVTDKSVGIYSEFGGSDENKYFEVTPDGVFIPQLSSDPSSPTEGTIWYNTTDNEFKARDNDSTITIGDGGGETYTAGDGLDLSASNEFSVDLNGSTLSSTSDGVRINYEGHKFIGNTAWNEMQLRTGVDTTHAQSLITRSDLDNHTFPAPVVHSGDPNTLANLVEDTSSTITWRVNDTEGTNFSGNGARAWYFQPLNNGDNDVIISDSEDFSVYQNTSNHLEDTTNSTVIRVVGENATLNDSSDFNIPTYLSINTLEPVETYIEIRRRPASQVNWGNGTSVDATPYVGTVIFRSEIIDVSNGQYTRDYTMSLVDGQNARFERDDMIIVNMVIRSTASSNIVQNSIFSFGALDDSNHDWAWTLTTHHYDDIFSLEDNGDLVLKINDGDGNFDETIIFDASEGEIPDSIIPNIAASKLPSIPDSNLSSNVALKDADNTFTGSNVFQGAVDIGNNVDDQLIINNTIVDFTNLASGTIDSNGYLGLDGSRLVKSTLSVHEYDFQDGGTDVTGVDNVDTINFTGTAVNSVVVDSVDNTILDVRLDRLAYTSHSNNNQAQQDSIYFDVEFDLNDNGNLTEISLNKATNYTAGGGNAGEWTGNHTFSGSTYQMHNTVTLGTANTEFPVTILASNINTPNVPARTVANNMFLGLDSNGNIGTTSTPAAPITYSDIITGGAIGSSGTTTGTNSYTYITYSYDSTTYYRVFTTGGTNDEEIWDSTDSDNFNLIASKNYTI